jgi:hypothetical protein
VGPAGRGGHRRAGGRGPGRGAGGRRGRGGRARGRTGGRSALFRGARDGSGRVPWTVVPGRTASSIARWRPPPVAPPRAPPPRWSSSSPSFGGHFTLWVCGRLRRAGCGTRRPYGGRRTARPSPGRPRRTHLRWPRRARGGPGSRWAVASADQHCRVLRGCRWARGPGGDTADDRRRPRGVGRVDAVVGERIPGDGRRSALWRNRTSTSLVGMGVGVPRGVLPVPWGRDARACGGLDDGGGRCREAGIRRPGRSGNRTRAWAGSGPGGAVQRGAYGNLVAHAEISSRVRSARGPGGTRVKAVGPTAAGQDAVRRAGSVAAVCCSRGAGRRRARRSGLGQRPGPPPGGGRPAGVRWSGCVPPRGRAPVEAAGRATGLGGSAGFSRRAGRTPTRRASPGGSPGGRTAPGDTHPTPTHPTPTHPTPTHPTPTHPTPTHPTPTHPTPRKSEATEATADNGATGADRERQGGRRAAHPAALLPPSPGLSAFCR